MPVLTAADILPNDEYVAQRQRLLSQMLSHKKVRSLRLGDAMTFLFENNVTMRFQVQEMCRIENIDTPEGVAHEVKTYSALTTRPGTVAATLLIEYDEEVERKERLTAMVGIQDHVFLEVGDLDPVQVVLDDGQYNTERVSAVQFIQIPVSAEVQAALGSLSIPARLVCTHPEYTASVVLPNTLRAALLDDLAEN